MGEWLSIPRLVDLILLGMALEAFWLFRRHRKHDHPGAPPMLLHLISGALLLLAMKLALTESSYRTTPLVLCGGCEMMISESSRAGLCPCKKVSYCSRDCQKQHWRIHKLTCPTRKPTTIDVTAAQDVA